MWRLWALALGAKSGKSDREANLVALIRTVVVLFTMITNGVIIAGVLRHWNQ